MTKLTPVLRVDGETVGAWMDRWWDANRDVVESQPRLRLRTCKCGQPVVAEDDFDFCEALGHGSEV